MGLVSLHDDIEDRRIENEIVNGSGISQSFAKIVKVRFPARKLSDEVLQEIMKLIVDVIRENEILNRSIRVHEARYSKDLQKIEKNHRKTVGKLSSNIYKLQYDIRDLTGHLKNAERKIKKLSNNS